MSAVVDRVAGVAPTSPWSDGETSPPATSRRAPWAVIAHVDSLDAEGRAIFEDAVRSSTSGPGGRVVVATCHRVEVYGVDAAPAWSAPEVIATRLVRLDGPAAAVHVFRLAAGLESAVVGEDQILAQVREALRSAQADGELDPRLNRLFQDAVRVGRRARAIARPRARDLADPALDVLAARLGDLKDLRVLVVGSGPMGAAAARAVAHRGGRIVVAGRTPSRVARLAGRLGAPAADLRTAAQIALAEADGIIVALAGPWSELDEAIGTRAARDGGEPAAAVPPVVDLSAPSALSASTRLRLAGRFTGIDELARASNAPSADVEAFVRNADELVREGVREYARWLAGRRAAAAIRALRDRADRTREREVERLFQQIPDLGERERELVAALARRLTGSILHPALVSLRRAADDPDAADGTWPA